MGAYWYTNEQTETTEPDTTKTPEQEEVIEMETRKLKKIETIMETTEPICIDSIDH